MRASYFTTPPPPKPPPPKYPLFTKKFFSTTSFAPGHIFGPAGLAFGLYALGKAFLKASRDASARTLQAAQRTVPVAHPQDDRLAAVNGRGQYGSVPAR